MGKRDMEDAVRLRDNQITELQEINKEAEQLESLNHQISLMQIPDDYKRAE